VQYAPYEVPWNGGITFGEWVARYDAADPFEQKGMVDDFFTKLSLYFDKTSAIIAATGEKVEQNEELMRLYGGKQAFHARYPVIEDIKKVREKRVHEMTNAFENIKRQHPRVVEEILVPYTNSVIMTHQGVTTVAYLLRRFNFATLVPFLNTALFHRYENNRKRKDPLVNTADWVAVKDILTRHFRSLLTYHIEAQTSEGKTIQKVLRQAETNQNWLFENLHDYPGYGLPGPKIDAVRMICTEGIKWLKGSNDPNGGKPFVVPISAEWLRKNGMQILEGAGLIIPYSETYGARPSVEERDNVVMGAVTEGMSSPGAHLSSGGRAVSLGAGANYGRGSLSPAESAIVESSRLRVDVLKELGKHPEWELIDEDSGHSNGDELRRKMGIKNAEITERAVNRLRNHRPLSEPPVMPRISETPGPAARRLSRKEGRLRVLDETAEDEPEDDEDAMGEAAARTAMTGQGCECTDKDSTLIKMTGKMKRRGKLSDPARVRLIDEYYREVKKEGLGKRVCYSHLQFVSTKMGLKVRKLGRAKMEEILGIMNASKQNWGKIQSDPITGILFTQDYRGVPQNQDLRSYRYRPGTIVIPIDWTAVRKEMKFEEHYQTFKQTGTVVLDCFDWVTKDKKLMEILRESYEMYDYHSRAIDGNSNLGWCRTMYHSGIQQLMRGDPLYWLYYAMLREETNLISYPYYTKYTKVDDKTFFRHIDLNIAECVATGKGADAIQGSVSWDQEDHDNCTEMLDCFHHHIKGYQEWRQTNNQPNSTGKIERWLDKEHWPEPLREKYPDVRWMKKICKPGDVRISDPRLPHGSTGPATKVRRTMLPWFVKVHNDMSTMEIPEMGSYAEIALAHQQLTAAPTSPSGHANMYGGIKWPFPGDVNPTFTTAVGKAVNCQIRWDSALVRHELRSLFVNPNYDKIMKWVKGARKENAAMVKRNWEITKQLESAAFCEDKEVKLPGRSFFVNKGKHPERDSEWWKYDGQVEQETALTRLREELSLSGEERGVYANRERISTTGRSRGSTVSSTMTPTSQVPTPHTPQQSGSGSPMQISDPPRSRSSSVSMFSPNSPTQRFSQLAVTQPATPTQRSSRRLQQLSPDEPK
jgi:hypothetical protein